MSQETILILGATRGLGKAIATEFNLRDAQNIEIGSSTLDNVSKNRVFMQCDLSNINSVHDFLNRLKRKDGELYKVNRFFWVAGRLFKGDLGNQTTDDILETIDVNFRNPSLIAKVLWEELVKKDGSFTVISSSSGTTPRADEAVYTATKHAQVGFTRSLGLEAQRLGSNLKVSLFLPGGMKTPFWDKNPVTGFDQFLDPTKVAEVIVDRVVNQKEPYLELAIPRGSLG